jgi:hypothetical protein
MLFFSVDFLAVRPYNKSMTNGALISIFLGGATAPSAVAVSHLFGRVAEVRDRAVRLELDPEGGGRPWTIWLPRKALVARKGGSGGYELARWFKPDARQARAIERCAWVAGVSCA